MTAAELDQWLSKLTTRQKAALRYEWRIIGRPKQIIPQDILTTIDEHGHFLYHHWLIMAGRGFGKTRTGAETVRDLVMNRGYRRVGLIARTAGDARDVMVEGESGLMSVFPPWERPLYEPSKRRVTFPNGSIATTYSGDKPEQLRGPQHDLVWADELAAWRYAESWDQTLFGLRLGEHPLAIVTTTPKPVEVIRDLATDRACIVTVGTTYENVDNLAQSAVAHLKRRYENTRLGRQELLAELLDDVPGALWTRAILDANRLRMAENPETGELETITPPMRRVVVAIDPAVTAGEESNETGIIVAGVGQDGHGYVLDDVTVSGSPDHWARVAVFAYYQFEADRIVAETNQGGDMVENTIRMVDKRVPYKGVRASRGKAVRAEPVSALYEQGRVHHVGFFAELEDQLCTWLPGEDSPDRLDALVWAFTELMLERERTMRVHGSNPIG